MVHLGNDLHCINSAIFDANVVLFQNLGHVLFDADLSTDCMSDSYDSRWQALPILSDTEIEKNTFAGVLDQEGEARTTQPFCTLVKWSMEQLGRKFKA